MTVDDALLRFRRALEPSGLNVVGVAAPHVYDAAVPDSRRCQALFPETRAILVVGSGGPALWNAFLGEIQRDPRALTSHANPLDAFVERQLAVADAAWEGVPRRWFVPAGSGPIQLDFRVLGHAAGLGSTSRLGLLLSPIYGPWLGLRGACFLAADLQANEPGGPDRCAACPAPCMRACPGRAFVNGQWNVDRCAAFHSESTQCAIGCDARVACPEGAAWRYPQEEIVYHYNREAGRAWLRRLVGVEAATDQPSEGPCWRDWRRFSRVRD